MKPYEDVQAGMEEIEVDPYDLYASLGTLIVEGRLSGLAERGYREDPYCLPPHGQNRHKCDITSEICQQQAVLSKHMLLLWKYSIPMSLEVILHHNCCKPENFEGLDTETSCNIRTSSVLLEKWNIHILPKVSYANITPQGLILAVHSFLYFSQLRVWCSLSGDKSPQNVQYSICVPGEASSKKISKPPKMHVFPVVNVGKNSAVKVTVQTLPHNVHLTIACKINQRQDTEERKVAEVPKTVGDGIGTCVQDYELFTASNLVSRGKADKLPSRTGSSAESMIGDCLLDPLQWLHCQSSSYSGTSSIEAPERPIPSVAHNRKECVKGHNDEQRRHQRCPIVECFLRKEREASSELKSLKCQEMSLNTMKYDSKEHKRNSCLNETKAREVSSCYYEVNQSTLSNQEMQFFIETLCQKFICNKYTTEIHSLNQNNCLQFKGNVHINIPDKKFLYKTLKNLLHITSQSCKSFIKSDVPTPKKKKPEDSNLELHRIASAFSNLQMKLFKKYESTNVNGEQTVLKTSDISLQNQESKLACDTSHASESKEVVDVEIKNTERSSQSVFYLQHDCESIDTVNIENSTSENLHNSSQNLNTSATVDEDTSLIENGNTTSLKTEQHRSIDNRKDTKNQKLSHSKTWSEGLSQLCIKACLTKSSCLLKRCLPVIQNNSSVPPSKKAVKKSASSKVPSAEAKANFRKSLDNATSLVFYRSRRLPLTSSPVPFRKSGTSFDFDSSLTSVSAIKRAFFGNNSEEDDQRSVLSTSAPPSTTSSLLCNFEESVLNGCLEPVSTVDGFTAEIGASGSFCPRHRTFPVIVFFYTLGVDKAVSPYLGHISLERKGYHVPKQGTVQVTLFNPHRTVVKMFVVKYSLSDMPPNCQTFMRQRTLYMPVGASQNDPESQKWLRYLIHLRFASSKSGRIYLHTDVRLIIFRKSDVDTATIHGDEPYELRSFIQEPLNPKFSPLK